MKKYFLATTLLLLVLCANTPAQNRSDKEILVGLRDFVMTVKYLQADGLEASQRPIILQRLQERAKDQLTKAEIPLLSTPDDTNIISRPVLTFVVTANKDTKNAFTAIVETKLYERVRLSRDATKEMTVTTWFYDGYGVAPVVTEKVLTDLLDSQVNRFIEAFREANPNLKAGESSGASLVAPAGDNANSLAGLKGVRFFLAFRSDPPETAELKKALQQEAEAKLLMAQIPVLKGNEKESAGNPVLYLFITLSQPLSSRHAIEIESRFWQQVQLTRDLQKEIPAVTWESQSNDGPPITDDAVHRVFNSQLDEFIKAYIAANPMLPPRL